MRIKNNKAQSIVEYAILLGVVIAALLIMQSFVKRGYQGSLKDSADKMGDQFSAGGTAIEQKREMDDNQVIHEEVATDSTMSTFAPTGVSVRGTVAEGVYSYTNREGGEQTSEVKTDTDAAKIEKARLTEYQTDTATDFTDPF